MRPFIAAMLAASALSYAAVAAPPGDAPPVAPPPEADLTPANAPEVQAEDSGRKLSANLDGASEAPGPGDGDGAGTFEARVNPGQGQICYKLAVSNILPAGAAHIHRGAEGSPGPVAVALAVPSSGSSEECKAIDRALAQELIQSPEAFYVNVHNAPFPAGAVRGQLAKGS